MTHHTQYAMVITTYPNEEDAQKAAQAMVQNHLAACVQLIEINSFYEWDHRINNDREQLLLIKTKMSRYNEIEQFIMQHHPYEVPEIIATPIQTGSHDYLKWIDKICKDD